MRLTALAMALTLAVSPAWSQDARPGAHFIENWDIDGDGVVDLGDIETRRGDVFLTFDADDNGALDADEYVYFDAARANDMEQMGAQGAGPAMRRASEGMTLAFNDTDGNGEVSRAEFLARAGDWLAMLDRDGDGRVTSSDFGRG
ncbi:EF hand [Roseivivax sp. THAF40]|uniref:EF-hand domain-containing protein n=1 Tax=unclassified Roseivivax TaxID=2639302 RepID=UPI0012685027|nr:MULTISPECIES: EF-hand domain-containing protein [unclassified Roseivivax]QFS84024.1 EF hand [Roseivivax sp. THAF197b]QFT47851.1 EF hand [Roseivivax sp. THAF40]